MVHVYGFRFDLSQNVVWLLNLKRSNSNINLKWTMNHLKIHKRTSKLYKISICYILSTYCKITQLYLWTMLFLDKISGIFYLVFGNWNEMDYNINDWNMWWAIWVKKGQNHLKAKKGKNAPLLFKDGLFVIEQIRRWLPSLTPPGCCCHLRSN